MSPINTYEAQIAVFCDDLLSKAQVIDEFLAQISSINDAAEAIPLLAQEYLTLRGQCSDSIPPTTPLIAVACVVPLIKRMLPLETPPVCLR